MNCSHQLRSCSLTPLLILLSLFVSSGKLWAAIDLPTNLTTQDRKEALRIIGFGTSTKILTDPYPLGGYAGFELSLSIEDLPTDDLAVLGNHLTNPQQDALYPKLTIGKGLYDNLDLFMNFTPYNHDQHLAQYGGLLRWGFYQATFLPLSSAVLVHVSSANVSNKMTAWTYGLDFIGGINVNNVALYAGAGILRATGNFIGGERGVTDSNAIEKESVTGFHTLAGANVHISDYFFTVELDRYTVSVFSAKAGVMF
jgi:hypothetical protein